MNFLFFPLGILFGFLLSRAGATTYDYYAKLFLFQDLQLMWVIAAAAGVGAVGVFILKRVKASTWIDRKPISFEGKPWKGTLIVGAILFGIGWGVAGACPGTALAMLGEGKLGAIFTLIGLLLGTYLFGFLESRKLSRPS